MRKLLATLALVFALTGCEKGDVLGTVQSKEPLPNGDWSIMVQWYDHDKQEQFDVYDVPFWEGVGCGEGSTLYLYSGSRYGC